MSNHNNGDLPFYGLIFAWALIIAAYGWLVESSFMLSLAGYTSTLALFALSINVMLGGVGEVPLGQCLFFGLGAYAVGIGMKKFGLSYEQGLVLATAVSVVLAAAIGSLTLRLTGAYFSIVSWGLASVAVVVALNLEHFTGGGMGIFGLPAMHVFSLDLSKPANYFFITASVLVVTVIMLRAVRDSRFGDAMESVRQNRHLASALGINVFRQRVKAFMLSGALASIAGGLSVPYTQIVTPEALSVGITVDALLMVLLGGLHWLFGPVVGAMGFSIIPFYLNLDVNVRMLVFSTAIILIMMFMPGGLHELGLRLYTRMKEAVDARH